MVSGGYTCSTKYSVIVTYSHLDGCSVRCWKRYSTGRLKGIIASLAFWRCLRLVDRICLGEGFGCAKSDTGPVQLRFGHYALHEFRIPLLVVFICGVLHSLLRLVEDGQIHRLFLLGWYLSSSYLLALREVVELLVVVISLELFILTSVSGSPFSSTVSLDFNGCRCISSTSSYLPWCLSTSARCFMLISVLRCSLPSAGSINSNVRHFPHWPRRTPITRPSPHCGVFRDAGSTKGWRRGSIEAVTWRTVEIRPCRRVNTPGNGRLKGRHGR
jgi:hypothetical protein